MAIDTAAKRAAAGGAGLPWAAALSPPDNEIDAIDRASLAGAYGFGDGGGDPPIDEGGEARSSGYYARSRLTRERNYRR